MNSFYQTFFASGNALLWFSIAMMLWGFKLFTQDEQLCDPLHKWGPGVHTPARFLFVKLIYGVSK